MMWHVPSGCQRPATSIIRVRIRVDRSVVMNVREERAAIGQNGRVTYLPDDLYAQVEASVPIACVDFVPVRETAQGGREFGLIRRSSPYGEIWCHLGGRIRRGETIAAALQRHARETIGAALALPPDPQPVYTYQWFPAADAPTDGTPFGRDERKHSIGMAFLAELTGEPSPRNEALDFAWFRGSSIPEDIWPGCQHLFVKLGIAVRQ